MVTRRIETIQYLRAAAALLVVVDHSIASQLDSEGGPAALATFAWFLGSLGVTIFFVISGFIMVYTTGENPGGRPSPLLFNEKRLVRIAPMYWLFSAVYMFKEWLIGKSEPFHHYILSLLFFPYLNTEGAYRPIYGVGWTLNYEMFFYSIFALSLCLSIFRGLAMVAIALLAIVVVAAALDPADGSGLLRDALFFWGDPIVLSFCAGMIAGVARLALEKRGFPRGIVIPAGGWWVLLQLVAIVGARLAFESSTLDPLIILATIVLVGLAGLLADPPEARLHDRLLSLLGKASFSIYLSHSFVVGPAGQLWKTFFPIDAWPILTGITLFLSSAIGLVIFSLVEKPLTRLFTRPRRVARTVPAKAIPGASTS